MKKLILAVLLAFALPIAVTAADDDLAVIVNKANTANNLTKSQLRKLVLGEQGSWPGGGKVVVVLEAPGSAERAGALRSICRMSEDDFNQHLMHSNFSGDSTVTIKVVASGAAARQAVASMAGAIGFVRPADANDTVKIVSVEGASAGQPDYKIKISK